MKLENQVCSLELAKQLKELGVKQESLFWWWNDGIYHYTLLDGVEIEDAISAFTVAELGEMLPNDFISGTDSWGHYCCWSESNVIIVDDVFNADTEANARAKMLIYLLENNLLNRGNK